MTKLILSSGNIMGGAAASMDFSSQRSNTELTNSFKVNFENAIQDSAPRTNGNGTHAEERLNSSVDFRTWTSSKDEGKTICIPSLDYNNSALQEEREQYDITVKLFYLPGVAPSERAQQTREALQLVLNELKVPSIDLMIVSFPGTYFDEESEDCPEKIKSRGPVVAEPEPIDTQIETWQILEKLHDEGLVKRLGVSEFGTERLKPFLERARIRPVVDQINLRDCCSVPKALLGLAKTSGVELLVHNDTSNVLPRGTVRELLGCREHGCGVLASDGGKTGDKRKEREGEELGKGLRGEVEPQWVIKYTSVVQNRGVVENKGYFASALVQG